jgi:hypothetical protein
VIAALIFSLGFGIIYAFVNEYFRFLHDARPEEYEKWHNLAQEFKSAGTGLWRMITLRRHN